MILLDKIYFLDLIRSRELLIVKSYTISLDDISYELR